MAQQQQNGEPVMRRKLVIIGDGACGKTSLLSVFTLALRPNRLRKLRHRLSSRRQICAARPLGYRRPRRLRAPAPLAYSKAHVILIGFSVDSPDSLDNVKHKWAEEARERCPTVPIILVALKKDLRDDPLARRGDEEEESEVHDDKTGHGYEGDDSGEKVSRVQ
ncbi:unnamed protein product [Alternaria alternata]